MKRLGFTQFDNANPHHSITIERNLDDSLTNEELEAKAAELHAIARGMVEKRINKDIREAKRPNGSDTVFSQ